MEFKLESTYKGTRILYKEDAKRKRELINRMVAILDKEGFEEIQIPIIQLQSTFKNKVGNDNMKMMYAFKDQGDRDLCLAPEYTAVVQQLSTTVLKPYRNQMMFYVGECFRGENPQAGRYRQFTQLGVEIINPTTDLMPSLQMLAFRLCHEIDLSQSALLHAGLFKLNTDVSRGLDYYQNGLGFEITCEELGAQRQVCGGGVYEGGMGFAIGIDRLLTIK
jgi:histidyl-tRNA synthetase